MHSKKYTRSTFDPLVSLYLSQEWLVNKGECVEKLLDLCKSSAEKELVIDLLERFTFLSSRKCEIILNDMVDQIFLRWALPEDKTQIVGMGTNADPDSSFQVMQMLKRVLAARGYRKPHLVNIIGNVQKNVAEYPNIVLVDEFVGTGTTVSGRIRSAKGNIESMIKSKSLSVTYDIRVCVMAAMSASQAVIKDVEYYSSVWLTKGISEWFAPDDIIKMTELMLGIESYLDKDALAERYKEFPSLGWGGAEALYAMDNGNTPNSVFPIFWWPAALGKQGYQPILARWD